MSRKVSGIIILVLCFYSLGAQNFATRKLEYLSGLMTCSLPRQSETFYCPSISSLPLLVEYDNAGTVTHLGIAIFPEDMKKSFGKQVCDFQERLFLELFLQKDETKARKLLNEHKILISNINFGVGSLYVFLENSLRFASRANENGYILMKDSLTWISSWYDSTRNFSLRFLSNYDLILGMDSKEAGIWFSEQLQNFHCDSLAIVPPLVETGELEQLSRSVYVRRGKYLYVKSQNNHLYFSPDTATCTFHLLHNRKFIEESITNLFNHPNQQVEGLELQIKHLNYGKSLLYRMKLSDFQCFMSDNYEIFTGITYLSPDTVKITVTYQGRFYNCWHDLHIQTTPDNLFSKTDTLKATLITFIPNQNIDNLYKEKENDSLERVITPETQALYRLACDSLQLVALAQTKLLDNAFQNESANTSYYAGLPITAIKEKEYIFAGTEKKMNNNELLTYFREYCPEVCKTVENGFKITKKGNICIFVGSALAVGGLVGRMFTLKTDMYWGFSGFIYGGLANILIGSIVIDSGNRKVRGAIEKYNNDCINKNKTITSLNFGVTQSGGVGLTLNF